MDKELDSKERLLERLRVDKEIEGTKADIEEKKAYERQMRKVEGRDWKKMFMGIGKSIKPNKEAIQDMYTINPPGRKR